MCVVTTDTCCAHDHRSDQTHAVAEHGRGSIDNFLVGIVAQAFECTLLKFVKLMRRAILEGKIGNEAVTDIFLLRADHLAEFQ